MHGGLGRQEKVEFGLELSKTLHELFQLSLIVLSPYDSNLRRCR